MTQLMIRKMLIVLSIIFATLETCSGEVGSFSLTKVEFPNELIMNERNYFTLQGNFNKNITSGTISGKVYKGPFKLMTKIQDLCTKAHCPLFGYQEIISYIRPPNVAQMSLKLMIEITDQDYKRVTCFQISTKLIKSKEYSIN